MSSAIFLGEFFPINLTLKEIIDRVAANILEVRAILESFPVAAPFQSERSAHGTDAIKSFQIFPVGLAVLDRTEIESYAIVMIRTSAACLGDHLAWSGPSAGIQAVLLFDRP